MRGTGGGALHTCLELSSVPGCRLGLIFPMVVVSGTDPHPQFFCLLFQRLTGPDPAIGNFLFYYFSLLPHRGSRSLLPFLHQQPGLWRQWAFKNHRFGSPSPYQTASPGQGTLHKPGWSLPWRHAASWVLWNAGMAGFFLRSPGRTSQ